MKEQTFFVRRGGVLFFIIELIHYMEFLDDERRDRKKKIAKERNETS